MELTQSRNLKLQPVDGHQAVLEQIKLQIKQLTPKELQSLQAEINQELHPSTGDLLDGDELELIRSLFC